MPLKLSLDSKKAEIMQLYHSDGVLEIIAGSILLNLGFDIMNNAESASLFTWIPILLLSSIKNRFSIPRIGVAKFETDEKQIIRWSTETAVGLAVWLLAFSLLILGNTLGLEGKINLPWGADYHSLFFGLACGIMLSLAAWLIPLRRLFVYAAVSVVVGIVSCFLFPLYVTVFVVSLVLLIGGVRLLMAFMREYPDPDKDQKKK